MSSNMYAVAGDGSNNEELALRMQAGDRRAEEVLISQNEGYLKKLASNYASQCEKDLKQEGAMALLEAARRFDYSYGTKLLTYATPAIESAMMDCASQVSLSLSIPASRYHQPRRAAHACAEVENKPEPAIIRAVSKELEVSPRAAAEIQPRLMTAT